jgi:ABC-type nitrate/sulfonate/bicarbonate transport system ATPase subunit
LRVDIGSKSFGGRPILAAVKFNAGPGEVLAVLAPSGTGKTTTLRIVSGLDANFAGSVVRPAGRIGAVFQEPRLLPWLSVIANIKLVAPDLTTKAADDLLGAVGLQGQGDLLPKQISLGMARRVAMVRALAVQPSLLILDEPFASLEPSLALRLAVTVTRQARDCGATVLVATHDLDQAAAIADRILVLSGTAPATLAADVVSSAAAAAEIRTRFAFLERDDVGG